VSRGQKRLSCRAPLTGVDALREARTLLKPAEEFGLGASSGSGMKGSRVLSGVSDLAGCRRGVKLQSGEGEAAFASRGVLLIWNFKWVGAPGRDRIY